MACKELQGFHEWQRHFVWTITYSASGHLQAKASQMASNGSYRKSNEANERSSCGKTFDSCATRKHSHLPLVYIDQDSIWTLQGMANSQPVVYKTLNMLETKVFERKTICVA